MVRSTLFIKAFTRISHTTHLLSLGSTWSHIWSSISLNNHLTRIFHSSSFITKNKSPAFKMDSQSHSSYQILNSNY